MMRLHFEIDHRNKIVLSIVVRHSSDFIASGMTQYERHKFQCDSLILQGIQKEVKHHSIY